MGRPSGAGGLRLWLRSTELRAPSGDVTWDGLGGLAPPAISAMSSPATALLPRHEVLVSLSSVLCVLDLFCDSTLSKIGHRTADTPRTHQRHMHSICDFASLALYQSIACTWLPALTNCTADHKYEVAWQQCGTRSALTTGSVCHQPHASSVRCCCVLTSTMSQIEKVSSIKGQNCRAHSQTQHNSKAYSQAT